MAAADMSGMNSTHKVPGKGGVWGGVWEWRGLEYPGPPREVRVPPLDPRPGRNGSRSSQDPGSALGVEAQISQYCHILFTDILHNSYRTMH